MPFITEERYEMFSRWLDGLEGEIPESGIAAFNFNIYEYRYDTGRTYDIQLIGADSFDEEDDDWRCDEAYTSEECVCCIPRTEDINDWQQGLALTGELVSRYLEEGRLSGRLKAANAVAVGFVDGDAEMIYKK